MELIKLNFSNTEIKFSLENDNKNISNFINSNTIYKNELHYSLKYLIKNQKKITTIITNYLKINSYEKFIFIN